MVGNALNPKSLISSKECFCNCMILICTISFYTVYCSVPNCILLFYFWYLVESDAIQYHTLKSQVPHHQMYSTVQVSNRKVESCFSDVISKPDEWYVQFRAMAFNPMYRQVYCIAYTSLGSRENGRFTVSRMAFLVTCFFVLFTVLYLVFLYSICARLSIFYLRFCVLTFLRIFYILSKNRYSIC